MNGKEADELVKLFPKEIKVFPRERFENQLKSFLMKVIK